EISGYPGDEEPSADNVAQPGHRATPTEGNTPDVNQQTYFFDSGSELNGDEVDLMEAVQEQAADDDDPELLSTEDVWKPTDTYKYVSTAAGNVRGAVGSSGAGKLEVAARK
ncbi:MAG: hypothetical protein RL685_1113, partial [Pseudomonadota bacterium]